MSSSRLDKRGRTTVPARIRSALDLRPGTRLRWHVAPTALSWSAQRSNPLRTSPVFCNRTRQTPSSMSTR